MEEGAPGVEALRKRLEPDPVTEAEREAVAALEKVLRAIAADDKPTQRSLLSLRQWAKLTSEAHRISQERRPRVAQLPRLPPAIPWIEGDGIDQINAGGDDGMANGLAGFQPAIAGLPFGGDQADLMRGMVHEIRGMGGSQTVANEAREIDFLVSACRSLVGSKSSAAHRERAAKLEDRLLALIEQKIGQVEERMAPPPPMKALPRAPWVPPAGGEQQP